MALTDVNGLYGATQFYKAASEVGVTPIIGAELRTASHAAVALIDCDRGYANLCRIITRIHCSSDVSLLDELAQHAAGLHVLTDRADVAEELLRRDVDRQRIWLAIDPAVQSRLRLRSLIDCSRKLDLPLTASAAAMYLPGDYDVVRLLAAIRTSRTFDSVSDADLPHRAACLRSSTTLASQLSEMPVAIANNHRLAEMCGAYRLLPREPIFPSWPLEDGRTAAQELANLCKAGLSRRYGRNVPQQAHERLARELQMIGRKGFSEYFLVVWDIVRYARGRGAPVAGRGSGASSLAAYLLGITNVCPLAFDIPFERFLNERREDFPDLDIDFCWRIRDDVINYVFRRWGEQRTAMVSMHATFQPQSALRETAKAFGFSDAQISRLDPARDEGNPRLRRICQMAKRIVGVRHNLSVHPGGVVISPGRIDEIVPLQPAAKGVNITQYDKRGVEAIGLVKIDLLGNRSLSTISAACELVSRGGGRVEVDAIPHDDEPTMRMLQRADTVGCNQIESPAMRHLLGALQPAGPRDLMKALALIRPGAASIGMKDAFVRRMRGLENVPVGFAPVDLVLADSCGVMLYEDDVMFAVAAVLGTSITEADGFRRAVQKCHDDEQRVALTRRFLAGCRANGVDETYAKNLWVQMAKFNAYSFCRAHAASYAALAYALAWLKCHHPREFWTAALNNNQSMYHPRVYVEQAKRTPIEFRLPCVNRSGAEFELEGEGIRVGLSRVGGLGPAGVAAVLDARESGPFEHLTDFIFRTRIQREEARSLVLCGALDFTQRSRPQLIMELELAQAAMPKRKSGSLLTGAAHAPAMAIEKSLPDYSPARKYSDERRLLGFSTRQHPMANYRRALSPHVNADTRTLAAHVGRGEDKKVRIAGLVEAVRLTRTERGQTMMFLTLDDEWGLFEATFFPSTSPRRPAHYGPYILTGLAEQQYGAVTLTADGMSLFDPQAKVPP